MTFGAFQPVDWLGNASTALPAIIAMSIWQAVGFHMVIWLAGLQTIPPTLYEAANIEGATRWQAFRYVTWPGLRNTAVLVLIVITMQAFALFAQIDVMTKGGPLDSTQTMVFQAVERGYRKQDIAAGLGDLGGPVPDRAHHLADPALPDPGEELMATVEGSEPGVRPHLAVRAPDPRSGDLHRPAPLHGDVLAEAGRAAPRATPRACAPSCRSGTSRSPTTSRAFQRAPVATFIFNSVLVTGVTVVLSLFVCSLAAFAFVFMKWRGRDVVLAIIIATLIVPFETIAIPMLIVVNNLPWIGTEGVTRRLAQQLPGADRAVHRRRPDDLSLRAVLQGPAARADRGLPGRGGDLVPDLLAGGDAALRARCIATAAILKFLYMYNQYLWPLMVTQAEGYRPVMVGLQYFFQLNTAWGELMAYLSVITVPVLAFYLVLQRAFISSIASTGVKG